MQDSEQKNFMAYYSQFKHKIYVYFLYRVSYNKAVAEDLCSEVFLKAMKHFDDFDQTKPFQAWIFKISHNHLVNYYKANKHDLALSEVEEFVGAIDGSAEERIELSRVMDIIEEMSETDKDILLMRYAQGMTNTEIAEALDKDEGAIRTQLSRSLAKLRAKLQI